MARSKSFLTNVTRSVCARGKRKATESLYKTMWGTSHQSDVAKQHKKKK